MKKKKEQFILMPDVRERVLIKNGKKYRLKKEVIGKDDHIKKVIFEEFDEKKFNKKRDEIIDYILEKTGLTMKEVLKHILNSGSMEDLNKLHKSVKRKTKPRVKEGCVSIILGRTEIEIVD